MYLILILSDPSHAGEHTKCNSTCVDQTPQCKWNTKCISTCIDQTSPISTRKQKCISSVEQNNNIPKMTQNISQHVITIPSHASWVRKSIATCVDTIFISRCVDQTNPKPASTQNVSQHVLKNQNHAIEKLKCSSTCVAQIPPVRIQNAAQHVLTKLTNPANTQNASQHVMTKPFCQRRHKMYHDLCRTNPSHPTNCISTRDASEDTRCN